MALYDDTGVSSSPMFLNWKPIQLDTSAMDRTVEYLGELAIQGKRQNAATVAKAKADGVPGVEDMLANDAAKFYGEMQRLQAVMEERLTIGNPAWVQKNDPMYKEAARQLASWVSPQNIIRLKEEKKHNEAIRDDVTKRGLSATPVFVDGAPQVNPDNPSDFLTYEQFTTSRFNNPNWDYTGNGDIIKPTEKPMSHQELNDRMLKLLDVSDQYSRSGKGGGPFNPNPKKDPKGAALAAKYRAMGLLLNMSGGGSSSDNFAQMRAAIDYVKTHELRDQGAVQALLEGYRATAEYLNGITKPSVDRPTSSGYGVLLSENGQVDASKVLRKMYDGKDFATTGEKDKNGKAIGLSYVDHYVTNMADMFKNRSTTSEESFSTVNLPDGGGVDEFGNPKEMPLLQFFMNGDPYQTLRNHGYDVSRATGLHTGKVTVPTLLTKAGGGTSLAGVMAPVTYSSLPAGSKRDLSILLGIPYAGVGGITEKPALGDEDKAINYPLLSKVAPNGQAYWNTNMSRVSKSMLENAHVVDIGRMMYISDEALGLQDKTEGEVVNQPGVFLRTLPSGDQYYDVDMTTLNGRPKNRSMIELEVVFHDDSVDDLAGIDGAMDNGTWRYRQEGTGASAYSAKGPMTTIDELADRPGSGIKRIPAPTTFWFEGERAYTTKVWVVVTADWSPRKGTSQEMVNVAGFAAALGLRPSSSEESSLTGSDDAAINNSIRPAGQGEPR